MIANAAYVPHLTGIIGQIGMYLENRRTDPRHEGIDYSTGRYTILAGPPLNNLGLAILRHQYPHLRVSRHPDLDGYYLVDEMFVEARVEELYWQMEQSMYAKPKVLTRADIEGFMLQTYHARPGTKTKAFPVYLV